MGRDYLVLVTSVSSIVFVEVEALNRMQWPFQVTSVLHTPEGADLYLSFLGTTLAHSAVVLDGPKQARILIP